MRMRRFAPLAALAAGALFLAGCAGAGDGPAPAASSASATRDPLTGTVTVLAAASLTDTFGSLARSFEKQHPNVTIRQSFGGSATLAAQIVQGAPVDVFASAADAPMATVTRAGLASHPVEFATNVLELVVPKGNPAHIASLKDLTRPGVKTILCDPTQPCGSASVALFRATGLSVTPVSLEQDVSSVLTKVELDEADAGLVYVTDAKAAGGKVQTIAIPEAKSVVNDYPIVVLKGAPNPRAAKAYEEYLTGPVGSKVLRTAGFGTAEK
jgi:molybdate transport system substrate-binding protein